MKLDDFNTEELENLIQSARDLLSDRIKKLKKDKSLKNVKDILSFFNMKRISKWYLYNNAILIMISKDFDLFIKAKHQKDPKKIFLSDNINIENLIVEIDTIAMLVKIFSSKGHNVRVYRHIHIDKHKIQLIDDTVYYGDSTNSLGSLKDPKFEKNVYNEFLDVAELTNLINDSGIINHCSINTTRKIIQTIKTYDRRIYDDYIKAKV